MATIFWGSLAALLYTLVGYPLLLRLIVWLRGERTVRQGAALPSVTLLISAFNEAASIGDKLRNSLALAYPRELLTIVVISDASDDGTDDIVRQFAAQGVRLHRQQVRRGKTAGLNAAMREVSGEIVVFSDANALYQENALRMLVRNFADPEVGCVTGQARYLDGAATAAQAGEIAYWDYETGVKRLETAVGSTVGGDGAIYAIRRILWRELPENAINDFLNPLQIVAAGWRALYEPDAICHEEAAGSAAREYRRRVRIVSRSWRAIFQEPAVLNPFRVGLFTLSVLSHKILRWFCGVFVLLFAISAVAMLPPIGRADAIAAALIVSLAAAAMVSCSSVRRAAAYGGYFLVISVASLVGVINGTLGRVSATWIPPRAQGVSTFRPWSVAGVISPGRLLALGCVVATAAFAAFSFWRGVSAALEATFWGSLAALAYVYVGYPLLLRFLKVVWCRKPRREPMLPSICLFITANDEESVIDAKLRNSLQLEYPRERLRILVASDGSVDRTNEIVRGYEADGVTLAALPERRGKIAAINAAMAGVDEEIVVFSDANTFLRPRALHALVRNFADPEVGAVSGDVALVGERAALARPEDLYYRYERWLQQAESDIGSMVGVDGALYAVRRELFIPPPSDTILDDMAIPMAVIRAGRRVVFEGEALGFERGSDTAFEEFARKCRVVAGAVQFLRRSDSAVPLGNLQIVLALTSHKALRWLSPVFAALAFGTSIALSTGSSVFAAAAIGQLAFFALGALGCIPALRKRNLIGLAHYFCLVQAAAAVGFLRGLSGRQAVTWRRFAHVSAQTT